MENRIPVLTIRYGVILIYDEIVETADKNSMEVLAELPDKFLTEERECYDCNNTLTCH